MTQTPTDALRLVPSMPTVELTDDMLFKIETGETVTWGELKRRQYEQAVRNFNTMREDGSLPAPASPLPGGGWQDISTAPKDEGVKVMAFDGKKVGEAVLYGEWEESNDFDEAVLRWRWANDSCSCCWGKAEPQPTHWMPLPAAPTGDAT